jgi:anthranilate synthase component I
MQLFRRFTIKKFYLEKLNSPHDQFGLFKLLSARFNKIFILESLVGPKDLSEFSIIGFDPELTVTCDREKFRITDQEGQTEETEVSDPLNQLRGLIPVVQDNRFRYLGGAVGYVCYDAVRFWEKLPPMRLKKLDYPMLEFGIFTDGILYNHVAKQAYYFSVRQKPRAKELKEILYEERGRYEPSGFWCSTPKRTLSKKDFVKKVTKTKKYIQRGDIYQVVLSKKMKFKIRGNVLNVYERLREINPSPYMYFFRMGERHILGSSPEMLLRITGNRIETFPIAGTRPVSKNAKRNKDLRMELLRDEKEIAEHTMLVDLARNDIGRVSKYGTVHVKELMKVKKFSHVQHMISHVTGILREGYDSQDALKAVFPAGTVSGAPKVRAMEIIDELEPNFRGPYAGTIGYFSCNGSCDFAISIRSVFTNRDEAFIQTGAGIVMDSDPDKEWMETEHKANALLRALQETKGRTKS